MVNALIANGVSAMDSLMFVINMVNTKLSIMKILILNCKKLGMILHYNLTVMKTSTLHDYSNNAYTIRKLLTLEPVNGSNTNFTTQ